MQSRSDWQVITAGLAVVVSMVSCGGSLAMPDGQAAPRASSSTGWRAADSTKTADVTKSPSECESKIYFDHGKTELGAVAKSRIVSIATCIKERRVDTITLEGRTDPLGSPEDNRRLGLARAQVVSAALRSEGVADAELEVVSNGAKKAATTHMRWSENRIVKVEAQARPKNAMSK